MAQVVVGWVVGASRPRRLGRRMLSQQRWCRDGFVSVIRDRVGARVGVTWPWRIGGRPAGSTCGARARGVAGPGADSGIVRAVHGSASALKGGPRSGDAGPAGRRGRAGREPAPAAAVRACDHVRRARAEARVSRKGGRYGPNLRRHAIRVEGADRPKRCCVLAETTGKAHAVAEAVVPGRDWQRYPRPGRGPGAE